MSSQNSAFEPEQPVSIAIWNPAWHEMDQGLMVGLRQKYYFFDQLPARFSSRDCDYVFFNGVDPASDCEVRFAKVVRILHAKLGEILRVDTMGLDYIFYPADGEEVVIDAEENPGTLLSGSEAPLDDWELQVQLVEVSLPLSGMA